MTRKVLEPITDWEPEEARDSVKAMQDTLTVDLELDDEGNVSLVIGIDDTLAPDFVDGPCNGFEPLVEIRSIADLLIEQEKETQRLLTESDPDRDWRCQALGDYAEYLETEAAKLRAAFPNKACGH